MNEARKALRLKGLTPEQRRKLADFVKSGNRTIEDFFKEIDKEAKAERHKEAITETISTLVESIEHDMAKEKSLEQALVESKGRELEQIWQRMKIERAGLKEWAKRLKETDGKLSAKYEALVKLDKKIVAKAKKLAVFEKLVEEAQYIMAHRFDDLKWGKLMNDAIQKRLEHKVDRFAVVFKRQGKGYKTVIIAFASEKPTIDFSEVFNEA